MCPFSVILLTKQLVKEELPKRKDIIFCILVSFATRKRNKIVVFFKEISHPMFVLHRFGFVATVVLYMCSTVLARLEALLGERLCHA